MRLAGCMRALVFPMIFSICFSASGCGGDSTPDVSVSGPADPATDPAIDFKNSTTNQTDLRPDDPTIPKTK